VKWDERRITNKQWEEGAALNPYQEKTFCPGTLPVHAEIALPLSICRSSFGFALPGHSQGRTTMTLGRAMPHASGRVHRQD